MFHISAFYSPYFVVLLVFPFAASNHIDRCNDSKNDSLQNILRISQSFNAFGAVEMKEQCRFYSNYDGEEFCARFGEINFLSHCEDDTMKSQNSELYWTNVQHQERKQNK